MARDIHINSNSNSNNNNNNNNNNNRRREKLLAVYLNFVHSNRGAKMKPVRQALVLTYRTKPVPAMKYALLPDRHLRITHFTHFVQRSFANS